MNALASFRFVSFKMERYASDLSKKKFLLLLSYLPTLVEEEILLTFSGESLAMNGAASVRDWAAFHA
jgi:hypothetical protein